MQELGFYYNSIGRDVIEKKKPKKKNIAILNGKK
jgi:hypothetical protein